MVTTPTATPGKSRGIREVKVWSPKKDARANPYAKASFGPLVGGGLGFGRVDFDAALEVGAVLDADARRGNVSDDRAIPLDLDAAASVDVADDMARDADFAGVNFGMKMGGGAHSEFVSVQRNRAFHFAVNLQVFRAADLTLDFESGAQTCGTTCSGATESGRRGSVECNNWRR